MDGVLEFNYLLVPLNLMFYWSKRFELNAKLRSLGSEKNALHRTLLNTTKYRWLIYLDI